MNIGNPIKAIPRYAKIVGAGLRNLPNPETVGMANNALYNAANYATNHRLETGAGILGAIAANQMLGKPVEGLVDFATFGMTNFRPDFEVGAEPPQAIMLQPGMQRKPTEAGIPTQPVGIPALNEEDRKRQRQYLERKMATDLLTLQALSSQPGVSEYV